MSATFDMSQFNRTLNEYMAKHPGTLEEIVDKKMYFVLRGAWERTPEVTRQQVERDLSVSAYRIRRSRKTGKLSRGRMILGNTSLLYALVNSRRGNARLKGYYGKEMEKAARKVANARIRAAGTARRGWLRPLLLFAGKTRDAVPSQAFTGRQPAGAGSGKVAQRGWSPLAEANYAVNIEGSRIDPRVEAALRDSLAAEEASMREYIARKVQEEIDKMR